MPLLLVLHDGDAEAAGAMQEAVWQLSESHWEFGTGLLLLTGVSPSYLTRHLSGVLERAGLNAALMVTPVVKEASLDALPAEGRDWVARILTAQS